MSDPISEDDSPSVEVDVSIPDPVDEESGDTTVIVEAAPEPIAEPENNSLDAVEVATLISLSATVAALATRVDALDGEVFRAVMGSEEALDAVDELRETDEAIIEGTDEAIVETIEGADVNANPLSDEPDIQTDAIAPLSAKVHPMFRSFKDWKNS